MSQLFAVETRLSSVAVTNLHPDALWYAGCTIARHEKRVAEHLSQRGVEHFLPLYESFRRWTNGRHHVRLPLFPGYIFVHIKLRDRLRVLEVPGFVRLVGFGLLPYALPESDIFKMREAMSVGVLAKPCPYLSVGTPVAICNGPLQGMTGLLLRRQNKYRVVISIDLIQQSMVVQVDSGDVVPIGGLQWCRKVGRRREQDSTSYGGRLS
jgi:transcription antitermination factor NusG